MLKRSLINTRGLYVDRVVIEAAPPTGTTEFFIDELRFGPIVGESAFFGTQPTGLGVVGIGLIRKTP